MVAERSLHLPRRKDLHDGNSLWCDSPHRTVRTKSLSSKLRADVVIIGAGISGALTALRLATEGHQVVVVDRREPGLGSTIASTAMIQFEIDTPLITLSEKIGRKNAERVYRRSFEAVSKLGALIQDHGIVANWNDRAALYLAGNKMGWRGLEREAIARARVDLPSTYLSGADVRDRFGIETTGAILSEGAAELDPAQASAGCLRVAQRLGASVIAPCEIAGVERQSGQLILKTDNDWIITCRRLVFATGYEVVPGIPRNAFDIVSSWAIATKPLKTEDMWPTRCLIWEAADPYLYLRTTADNRIIVGGEDSGLIDPERRASAIPAKAAKLLTKVKRLLNNPSLELDYAWAGAFAESPTGLPVLRPHPELKGAFTILGCGGNGITFSVVAADLVAKWIAGRRDADADIFDGT